MAGDGEAAPDTTPDPVLPRWILRREPTEPDHTVVPGQTHLQEQHPLWLQLDTHAVAPVVQEVLQPQELEAAQSSPVLPVHAQFQLPGLGAAAGDTDRIKEFLTSQSGRHRVAVWTLRSQRRSEPRGRPTLGPFLNTLEEKDIFHLRWTVVEN